MKKQKTKNQRLNGIDECKASRSCYESIANITGLQEFNLHITLRNIVLWGWFAAYRSRAVLEEKKHFNIWEF